MAIQDHLRTLFETAKANAPQLVGAAAGAGLLGAYTHYTSKRDSSGLSPNQRQARSLVGKYDEETAKLKGEQPGFAHRAGHATSKAVSEMADIFADHPEAATLALSAQGASMGFKAIDTLRKLGSLKEQFMTPEQQFAEGLSQAPSNEDEQIMARLLEMPSYELESFLKKQAGIMKKPAVRGETPSGNQPVSNVGDPAEAAAIRNYDHEGAKTASLKDYLVKRAAEKKEPEYKNHGFMAGQSGANKAMRRGDEGFSKYLASDELVHKRHKGMLSGMAKGLGYGAAGGAALGVALKALKPLSKVKAYDIISTLGRTERGKEFAWRNANKIQEAAQRLGRIGHSNTIGAGAAIGAALGVNAGSLHGVNKVDKEYLKERGIKSSWGGLKNEFTDEAEKKYIKKAAIDPGALMNSAKAAYHAASPGARRALIGGAVGAVGGAATADRGNGVGGAVAGGLAGATAGHLSTHPAVAEKLTSLHQHAKNLLSSGQTPKPSVTP